MSDCSAVLCETKMGYNGNIPLLEEKKWQTFSFKISLYIELGMFFFLKVMNI